MDNVWAPCKAHVEYRSVSDKIGAFDVVPNCSYEQWQILAFMIWQVVAVRLAAEIKSCPIWHVFWGTTEQSGLQNLFAVVAQSGSRFAYPELVFAGKPGYASTWIAVDAKEFELPPILLMNTIRQWSDEARCVVFSEEMDTERTFAFLSQHSLLPTPTVLPSPVRCIWAAHHHGEHFELICNTADKEMFAEILLRTVRCD